MGRPRNPNRMTRLVQARLTDDQYDWLAERAIHGHDGDLSKTVRESIDFSRMMVVILEASDPHVALDELLERSRQQEEGPIELYMDAADDEEER